MLFKKVWGEETPQYYSGIYYADQLSNNDYLLIGARTATVWGEYEFYCTRTDSAGDIIWEKAWAMSLYSSIRKVVKTRRGTYLIAGGNGYVTSNAFVSEITNTGTVLLDTSYNFGYHDYAYDIVETNDSNYVFCGEQGTMAANGYPVFKKIDRLGNTVWTRVATNQLDFIANQIKQAPDQSFIVLGRKRGQYVSYYEALDSAGNFQWLKYPFGSGDSIPSNPGVLKFNADNTFSIYYHLTAASTYPNSEYTGVLHTYTSNGARISEALNADNFYYAWLSDENQICATTSSFAFAVIDSTGLSKFLLPNGVSYTTAYIQTNDGGFLGYGSADNWANSNTRFQIVKFSADGKYQASDFPLNLSIYPNPSTSGLFQLEFDVLSDEDVTVRVYSSDGRMTFESIFFCPANSHTQLNIDLAAHNAAIGAYFLEISTSEVVIRKSLVLVGVQ